MVPIECEIVYRRNWDICSTKKAVRSDFAEAVKVDFFGRWTIDFKKTEPSEPYNSVIELDVDMKIKTAEVEFF